MDLPSPVVTVIRKQYFHANRKCFFNKGDAVDFFVL